MKAISIWQPWASLIAHDLKRCETRDWPTSHRGLVLIHASKRWTRDEQDVYGDFCQFGAVRAARMPATPPLGAIVAVAWLAECRVMDEALIAEQTDMERAMGAWCPGRFAWVLGGVRAVEPIPLRGRQGLFEVAANDIPPAAAGALAAACDSVRAERMGSRG